MTGLASQPLLTGEAPVDGSALLAIAHMPTRSLASLMDDAFARRLDDKDRMRIAVLLARKSYDEGGCPREPLNNYAWSAFQSEKPQIVWCDTSDSSLSYGRVARRARCGFSGETR